MNDRQENKLSMYLGVQSVCDRYNAVWAGLPAFAAAYLKFSEEVQTIQVIHQGRGRGSRGAAQEKADLRKEMVALAGDVAQAVAAYADLVRDHTLAAKVNYTPWKLLRCRDTEATRCCEVIHAAATGELANLVDHGVTAEDLLVLSQAISAYHASVSAPRHRVLEGKRGTEDLAAAFRRTDAVLKLRMDKLIGRFRVGHPEFHRDYTLSRMIVDYRGRKDQAGPEPDPGI